jgi:hypothetical protein
MISWHELADPLWWGDPRQEPPPKEKLWCGPASGVSIAAWKRDADGDGGLHPPGDEIDMFRRLRHHMHTLSFPYGWTLPGDYGPGFAAYGTERGEPFTWSYRSTFSHIISDITNGWPLGLCGWMDIDGKKKAHWVAVKGWGWASVNQFGIVTDSFIPRPGGDNRWLCWDALTTPAGPIWFLYLIRIADTDD